MLLTIAFAPAWRPVYLCASRRISLALLADLFAASGCLQLMGRSLLGGGWRAW